jgi:hypothetical protein
MGHLPEVEPRFARFRSFFAIFPFVGQRRWDHHPADWQDNIFCQAVMRSAKYEEGSKRRQKSSADPERRDPREATPSRNKPVGRASIPEFQTVSTA